MSRHKARREPRAHWLLFLLGVLLLLTELGLHGYATGAAAEGPHGAGTRVVTEGDGPVLRFGPGGAEAAKLPAGTLALTFDDGPDPRWTPRVLDLLRQYHAHAT